MKRQSLKTVSIGISAYNEGNNIVYLLNSILHQKSKSYIMQKIIVVSDGSTDDTVNKVRALAKNNSLISLIEGKERNGKKNRLIRLYKLNTSDILVICDGDIVLSDPFTVEKMIGHFDSNDVAVVGGNIHPVPAVTLVGKLVSKWHMIWYEARENFNKGNNVHNISGCIVALKKSFSKQLKFPKEIISETKFLYFAALKKNLRFRFGSDVVIFYRAPDNIYDYFSQTRRSDDEQRTIARIFGDWIYDEYKIPMRNKIKAFLKMMVTDPIFVPFTFLFFYIFVNLYPYDRSPVDQNGLWETVKSTKRGISTLNF